MRLVEDARSAWKWLSMWGLAIIATTPHAYEYALAVSGALTGQGVAIPPALKWTITALAVATAMGRLIKQDAPAPAPVEAPKAP
jgi:hypothetical protein